MGRVNIVTELADGTAFGYASFPSNDVLSILGLLTQKPDELEHVPGFDAKERVFEYIESVHKTIDPRTRNLSTRYTFDFDLSVAEVHSLGSYLSGLLRDGKIPKVADDRLGQFFSFTDLVINKATLHSWSALAERPMAEARTLRTYANLRVVESGTGAIGVVERGELGERFHVYYLSKSQLKTLHAFRRGVGGARKADLARHGLFEGSLQHVKRFIEGALYTQTPLMYEDNDLEILVEAYKHCQEFISTVDEVFSKSLGAKTMSEEGVLDPLTGFPDLFYEVQRITSNQPWLAGDWLIGMKPSEPKTTPRVSVWNRKPAGGLSADVNYGLGETSGNSSPIDEPGKGRSL